MKVLVTGGVRSGKSRHAESLLSGAVTYVAPGPSVDDADWAARIAAHRARRPASWRTLETRDLAGALGTDGPVIVDCLGTWLTGVLDERGLWDSPSDEVTSVVSSLLDETLAVLSTRDQAVLVTNEVGLGVVPEHRSGRLFRDLLGLVNQRLATGCDEVHLVVAGRVVRL
ncbi:bifunctional adenosylcobinamide kinase/adenosylcobinamide-phosphate guanylyltransferase [Nocardioides sp. CN2-186]|uniref:bifunctional adenosylcobinamide kinase/adenosylcobinamide-phosphate guanylyltransferase n=1 Tax=Nocardioides tweenelious TaxID=3156607 RepID=UPI0032B4CABA